MADIRELTKEDVIDLLDKVYYSDGEIEDIEDSINRKGLFIEKEFGQDALWLGYSGIKIMDKDSFEKAIEYAADEYIQERVDTSDDYIGDFFDYGGFVRACYEDKDYANRVMDMKFHTVVEDYVILND